MFDSYVCVPGCCCCSTIFCIFIFYDVIFICFLPFSLFLVYIRPCPCFIARALHGFISFSYYICFSFNIQRIYALFKYISFFVFATLNIDIFQSHYPLYNGMDDIILCVSSFLPLVALKVAVYFFHHPIHCASELV